MSAKVSSTPAKQRFPTSEEICARIRSDAVFNQTKAQITYFDSVKQKFIDLPFCQWKSIKDGGDIPWHRVYFIKYDSQVIWNREEKISGIQELYDELISNGEWQDSQFPSTPFQLLTWNILSDLYEKRITNLQLRKGQILDYLEQSNATMICLQEVTHDFFSDLQGRFRSSYHFAKTELPTNNLVFLSKVPFTNYHIISLNLNKQILCIEFHQRLIISLVHLTSNYHEKSVGNVINKRNLQLSQLLHSLEPMLSSCFPSVTAANNIIVGDFNTSTAIDLLSQASYQEIIFSDYTYNPETNRLAKLLSASQQKERFDRLFYCSTEFSLQGLTATVDTEVKHSDHYPVTFTIQFKPPTDKLESVVLPTKRILSQPNKYSLSLVLPVKFWKLIYQVSHTYSMNWKKWMPHIHFFFPFLEVLTYEEKEAIQKVISRYLVSGLSLEIEGLHYFQHQHSDYAVERVKANRSFTVYAKLAPKGEAILRKLRQELAESLQIEVIAPDADAEESSTIQFTPHLTIASIPSLEETIRFIQTHSRSFCGLVFPFKRLCYLQNQNQEYYEVMDTFGSLDFEGSMIDFLSTYLLKGSIQEIKEAGSAVFETNVSRKHKENGEKVHDYDLLVIGKDRLPREEFMAAAYRFLKTCGLFSDVRIVQNQHTHYLKVLTKTSSHYDIHYISNHSFQLYSQLVFRQQHPASTSSGASYTNWDLTVIDENSAAVYGASAYLRSLHETEIDAFVEKLKLLKNYGKRCGIYGLHYGYLSGIAFAILLSHYLHQRREQEPTLVNLPEGRFLIGFCQYYHQYQLTSTKSISVPMAEGVHHRADMSPMQIINPVRPYGNVTRTMTQSSFRFIQFVLRNHFFFSSIQANPEWFLFSNSGWERYQKTEVVAYCCSLSQLKLFQQLFDAVYLRMMILFEQSRVYPIGSNQATLVTDREFSFHYDFYLPEYSPVSLRDINTVWEYLYSYTEKNFGKEVFVQILSS